MNYNYEDYMTIVFFNKIRYRRNHQIKYNFRQKITEEDLNDGIMLNFPYNNTYYSYKSPATSIPISRQFKRSGVIPYVYIDTKQNTDEGTISFREKYFCMAIDSKYGNLTDFGGGVKKYESFTRAAARELIEESLNIFRFSPRSLYECSTAVYDNSMIILFPEIKLKNNTMEEINEIVKNYFNNLSNVVESETKGIFWIPESKFYDLIKSGKSMRYDDFIYPSIYKPVADLLRSVSNLNEIV